MKEKRGKIDSVKGLHVVWIDLVQIKGSDFFRIIIQIINYPIYDLVGV